MAYPWVLETELYKAGWDQLHYLSEIMLGSEDAKMETTQF